jgi:glycosyltransferase involved in cell wall biosynthesis
VAKKPRVLVIAEAANPDWVSVPLVGWSHARALASVADVHLVTQVRNRDAIAAAGLEHGRDFTAIDSEAVARLLWRVGGLLRGGTGRGWTTVTALQGLAYYWFEHLVWQQFGARIRRREFDLVHRVTPLSPTTPSIVAGRCARAGVPFVLGPLNGGVPWPKGFDGARRQELEWLSYVRDAYKLLPGYRGTRRHAGALLIGSQATWQQMPARYRHKCVYIPENAIDVERLPPIDSAARPGPLRVTFLGRLVPYKGPDMLLEAMLPLLQAGRATLSVIGDGPLLPALRERVASAGVAARVELRGFLAHRDALRALACAHVLGLPSIREFGGGVALEAMALGVVPLVVRYGGPAELVTPATGILIELGSRAEIVARVRAALEDVARDPAQLAPVAARARERVARHFTWSAKAAQVSRVYHWLLEGGSRPDFGMPIPD